MTPPSVSSPPCWLTLSVKGYKDVNPVAGSRDGRVGQAYLKEVVTAPDPRFVILVGEDMIAAPGEKLCEAVADRLDALSRLAAYFDSVIHGDSTIIIRPGVGGLQQRACLFFPCIQ